MARKIGIKSLLLFFTLVIAITAFLPLTSSAKADVNSEVLLSDLDDCLTDAEEASLLSKMGEVSGKTGLKIGIVITADLDGKTSKNYAQSFCESSFGKYSDSVVLLLFNSHDLPQYNNYNLYQDYIFTSDKGYDLLYNRIDAIFDRIYTAFDNKNIKSDLPSQPNVYNEYSSAHYYVACLNFCSEVERYGNSSTAVANGVAEFFFGNIISLFVGGVAGLITAIIFALNIKSKYTKKSPISAAQYLDKGRTNITRREDTFIREYTTSYTTSSSSSGGHGGGGSHRSGGGGGHRSGGGGGRHR